jgi:CrcB protein
VSRLLLAVALGSGVGGVARVVLGNAVQARAAGAFPLGTFVVNVTGSLALGVLMRYTMASPTMSTEMRVMLTTGFCGGYTTFSTFAQEALDLLETGKAAVAFAAIAANVLLGLAAVFVGLRIGRLV